MPLPAFLVPVTHQLPTATFREHLERARRPGLATRARLDRAALDSALTFGIGVGGIAFLGGWAEDRWVPPRYGLVPVTPSLEETERERLVAAATCAHRALGAEGRPIPLVAWMGLDDEGERELEDHVDELSRSDGITPSPH